MDPVINEIVMCKGLPQRESVWRNWQDYLRDVVQPQLDELAELKAKKSPKAKEN